MEETKRNSFCLGAARVIFGFAFLGNSLAADHTLPGLGTRIENSGELHVEDVQILSESALSQRAASSASRCRSRQRA